METNEPLEDGFNYTLNVVVFDILNGGNSAAYKPIKVWRGMKPIDPNWKKDVDGNDLTWIIWAVMGVLAVVVIVVLVIFLLKKRGYNKLL